MAEERKTVSSEMRNVQLSELTKEFLVAHRMVQEAGDHALEQIERFWGDQNESFIDEAAEPLWEAVDQLQEQILVLMTEVISEKLKGLKVTEI
jgi:hypothetical protein